MFSEKLIDVKLCLFQNEKEEEYCSYEQYKAYTFLILDAIFFFDSDNKDFYLRAHTQCKDNSKKEYTLRTIEDVKNLLYQCDGMPEDEEKQISLINRTKIENME